MLLCLSTNNSVSPHVYTSVHELSRLGCLFGVAKAEHAETLKSGVQPHYTSPSKVLLASTSGFEDVVHQWKQPTHRSLPSPGLLVWRCTITQASVNLFTPSTPDSHIKVALATTFFCNMGNVAMLGSASQYRRHGCGREDGG